MSARIEPSGECVIVTAKLSRRYGLCILFVYTVVSAFKALTPTRGYVSFPL